VWLIVLISLVFGCYNGPRPPSAGWCIPTPSTPTWPTPPTPLTDLGLLGALTIGRLVAIRWPSASARAHPARRFRRALVSLLAMLFWPHSLVAVLITRPGWALPWPPSTRPLCRYPAS